MRRRIAIAAASVLASAIYGSAALAADSGSTSSYVLIGVSAWTSDISGIAYNTNSSGSVPETHIDLNQDLGLGTQTSPSFVVDVHHSVPILPDLLIQYDHVVSDGASYDNRQITYNGVTYVANGGLLSQAALRQGRVLLYWNPIDNSIVDLRTGFGARWEYLRLSVSGQVQVTQPGGGSQTEAGSEVASAVTWLPMLNLGVIFHLPAGVSLGAQASYVSYASNYFFDASAGVGVRLPFGLVLDAGYRRLRFRLNDTSLPVDGHVVLQGPYAGLAWKF